MGDHQRARLCPSACSSRSAFSEDGDAVPAQLRELRQTMVELESMIQEVQDASAILEFRTASRPPHWITDASEDGAARLAAELEDELRDWRAQRNSEVEETVALHQRQAAATLEASRREGRDRERSRAAIREHHFRVAATALQQGVAATAPPRRAASAADMEHLNNMGGAAALCYLKSRLDSMVSPVEASRPEPPQDMADTLAAAAAALERKRARIAAQVEQVPDMGGRLDAELLDRAERSRVARHELMLERTELQKRITRDLANMARGRTRAFDDLHAAVDEVAAVPYEALEPLWPNGVHGEDLERTLVLAPRAAGKASTDSLMERLRRQGRQRIAQLRDDFDRKWVSCAPQDSHGDVIMSLERWKLETRLTLLHQLQDLFEHSQQASISDMYEAIRGGMDGLSDTFPQRPVESAERLMRDGAKLLEASVERADASLQAHCRRDMLSMEQTRRRVELCGLKRWREFRNGVESSTLHGPAVEGVQQLNESAQRLIRKCKNALPLSPEPIHEALGAVERVLATPLFRVWSEDLVPLTERMATVERSTEGLPDTVEGCALARSLLELLDEALTSCQTLRRRHDAHDYAAGDLRVSGRSAPHRHLVAR